MHTLSHTHTHPFNGPSSGTTRVGQYQKGKTSLDFTEARDSEWQRHQLGHMQVCTSLQTDNHASTSPLSVKALKARALKARRCTQKKIGSFISVSRCSICVCMILCRVGVGDPQATGCFSVCRRTLAMRRSVNCCTIS